MFNAFRPYILGVMLHGASNSSEKMKKLALQPGTYLAYKSENKVKSGRFIDDANVIVSRTVH